MLTKVEVRNDLKEIRYYYVMKVCLIEVRKRSSHLPLCKRLKDTTRQCKTLPQNFMSFMYRCM